jgi:hypothetical protein
MLIKLTKEVDNKKSNYIYLGLHPSFGCRPLNECFSKIYRIFWQACTKFALIALHINMDVLQDSMHTLTIY